MNKLSVGGKGCWYNIVPNKFSRRRVLKVGVGFMLGAWGATLCATLFSDCSTVLAQSEFMTAILWHNSSTGEIQIWFMNKYKLTGSATVLGEDGNPAFVGPPWSIVGISSFSRDRRLPRSGDPR
jgi:hypothetical protein